MSPGDVTLDTYLDMYIEKSIYISEMHTHSGEERNWYLATTAFKLNEKDSDLVGTLFQVGDQTGQALNGETLLFSDYARERYYRSYPDEARVGTCATPHCSATGTRVVVRVVVMQN